MAKLKLIALALAAGIAVPATVEAHGYRSGPAYPAWGDVQYGAPYHYYGRDYRRAVRHAEKDYRKHRKREAKAYKKLLKEERKYYARYGYPYTPAYAYGYGPDPYRYVRRYKHEDWDDDD